MAHIDIQVPDIGDFDEVTVIEMRPRDGEHRRFMLDVISRVGLPSRYIYAVLEDGELERRRED